MTQNQLRADIDTLSRVDDIGLQDVHALRRILAIVEPLAELSDDQVAALREENERSVSRMRRLAELEPQDADIWNADADAYAALARMLGGGR